MVVSNCCGGDVVRGSRPEHPLGDKYHIDYLIDVCDICGKECELIEEDEHERIATERI